VRWDFQKGNAGYVKKSLLHYIENRGETDLVFLQMFKADRFQDFSFSVWLARTPPELVMAYLHIDKATLDAIPGEVQLTTPK
jgi:oxalate decarboxylase